MLLKEFVVQNKNNMNETIFMGKIKIKKSEAHLKLGNRKTKLILI